MTLILSIMGISRDEIHSKMGSNKTSSKKSIVLPESLFVCLCARIESCKVHPNYCREISSCKPQIVACFLCALTPPINFNPAKNPRASNQVNHQALCMYGSESAGSLQGTASEWLNGGGHDKQVPQNDIPCRRRCRLGYVSRPSW